jgi:hypothetical protein
VKAADFLDEAPSADDFLGGEPVKRGKLVGRGSSPVRPPVRRGSVLQDNPDFERAPDPAANAVALFNALGIQGLGGRERMGNPDLARSPMYRSGAALLESAATGEPTPVQAVGRRQAVRNVLRAQKERQIEAARAEADAAFGEDRWGRLWPPQAGACCPGWRPW